MITFIPFGQSQTDAIKARIRRLLQDPATRMLNTLFNNSYHFSNPTISYTADQFLREIDYVIASQEYTIDVMGSEHQDPGIGHASYLINQTNVYGEIQPAFVKDTYIRFKITPTPAGKGKPLKPLCALNTTGVFHFLTQVPEIQQLNSPYGSVVMPLHFQTMAPFWPLSRYKHLQILFA